jgi:ribosomal protein S12 methylthiotransferase accessory factor YcaO
MEQLNVAVYDLPSVAKKKAVVATVSMSFTETLPTMGLALQLAVPMAADASIHGRKAGGGGEC